MGRSGLELPEFGFGGAHLGEMFSRLDDEQVRDTLDTAWRCGVRYFDTAPWYGLGLSERRIGNFLLEGDRADYIASTKVGRVLSRPMDPGRLDTAPWLGGLKFAHRFDYSYDGVLRSFEDSTQRLGLARVDLLFIHDLDRQHHPEKEVFESHWRDLTGGGMKALNELVGARAVGAIGAGVNDSALIQQLVEELDLDCLLVAMPYTLLNQESLEALDDCMTRNVKIIVGSPFASGVLATGSRSGAVYGYRPADPVIMRKVEQLEAICARHAVPLAAAALQFPKAHPAVISTIPGAICANHVQQNIANYQCRIHADFWLELRANGLIRKDAPIPVQGGSEYAQ
jgi:D-threo-aldose 1-dehydrogenase